MSSYSLNEASLFNLNNFYHIKIGEKKKWFELVVWCKLTSFSKISWSNIFKKQLSKRKCLSCMLTTMKDVYDNLSFTSLVIFMWLFMSMCMYVYCHINFNSNYFPSENFRMLAVVYSSVFINDLRFF